MLLMSIEIMCSEAWARYDPDKVKAEGQGSYLLSSQLASAQTYAQACKYAPPGYVLSNDAEPVHTTAQVLLLNGSDDPQDPPSNVTEAAQDMPNSLLVVAPGQGHTVGQIGCLSAVVVDFFEKGKTNPAVANACVSQMQPPAFRLG